MGQTAWDLVRRRLELPLTGRGGCGEVGVKQNMQAEGGWGGWGGNPGSVLDMLNLKC